MQPLLRLLIQLGPPFRIQQEAPLIQVQQVSLDEASTSEETVTQRSPLLLVLLLHPLLQPHIIEREVLAINGVKLKGPAEIQEVRARAAAEIKPWI